MRRIVIAPRQLLARAGLLALLCTATVSAQAQLVNGSFEPASGSVGWTVVGGGATTIPGWTGVDYGVEWFTEPTAPGGTHVVDLACYIWSAGGIEQTFATVPGEVYTVSFHLGTLAGAGRDGTCAITVDADGQTQAYTHTNLGGTPTWALKSFSFIADGASATIRFRCLQNAYAHFAYIDGVSLSAVVGTEDASFGAVKALFR